MNTYQLKFNYSLYAFLIMLVYGVSSMMIIESNYTSILLFITIISFIGSIFFIYKSDSQSVYENEELLLDFGHMNMWIFFFNFYILTSIVNILY